MPDYESDMDKQHRLDVEEMMRERDRREAARPAQVRHSNAGTEVAMPAASSEVARKQTVAQREAEHLAKYVPPDWATSNDITSYANEHLPKSTPEQDYAVRERIHDTLHPAWGDKAASAASGYLKEHMPEGAKDSLRAAARKWVDTVRPNARQDREIAENKELIRLRQKQVDEQARAAQAPVDGGEIDAPQGRQPVQMEREFADTDAKARYIEAVRRAQENAKK